MSSEEDKPEGGEDSKPEGGEESKPAAGTDSKSEADKESKPEASTDSKPAAIRSPRKGGKPARHGSRGPGDGEETFRVRTPRRGQLLGEVEQLLGDRRMRVRCSDGHTRLCRIPGKIRRRIWIKEGNIVLLEPWSVQTDEKGDILWRYTIQQADWLEKKGFLKGLEDV